MSERVVEGGKQHYAIARQDGQPMAFAGLCESFHWPDETVTRSFAIMTTTPNAEMSELHDRMPAILDQQDWPTWLGDVEGDCTTLLRPAPDGLLRVWPVDRRVGSPRPLETVMHIKVKSRGGIQLGDRRSPPAGSHSES